MAYRPWPRILTSTHILKTFMPSKSFSFALTLLFLMLADIAHSATTYYVDVAGSDSNPGTANSPFQTLQFAANVVNPGDTVIVRDGQYTTERVALIDIYRSGTPGQPITFMSEHSLGAKLDGNDNAATFGILVEPGISNLRFTGFELAHFERSGVNLSPQSANITIDSNYIHDIGRLCSTSTYAYTGIHLSKASSVSITNNVIQNIGRFAPGESECYPEDNTYMDYARGISLDGVTAVDVRGNDISEVYGGWGIQIYSGTAMPSEKIRIIRNKISVQNLYYDGQVLIAYPGLTSSRIVGNIFYNPTRQVLNFFGDLVLNRVFVINNRTINGVISKTRPKGVRFAGNVSIRRN